jgi:hypothetical protein
MPAHLPVASARSRNGCATVPRTEGSKSASSSTASSAGTHKSRDPAAWPTRTRPRNAAARDTSGTPATAPPPPARSPARSPTGTPPPPDPHGGRPPPRHQRGQRHHSQRRDLRYLIAYKELTGSHPPKPGDTPATARYRWRRRSIPHTVQLPGWHSFPERPRRPGPQCPDFPADLPAKQTRSTGPRGRPWRTCAGHA